MSFQECSICFTFSKKTLREPGFPGALQEKHTFYYSSNNPFFEGRRKRSSSRSEGCGPSSLEELRWRRASKSSFGDT